MPAGYITKVVVTYKKVTTTTTNGTSINIIFMILGLSKEAHRLGINSEEAGSPEKWPLHGCVCVCVCAHACFSKCDSLSR